MLAAIIATVAVVSRSGPFVGLADFDFQPPTALQRGRTDTVRFADDKGILEECGTQARACTHDQFEGGKRITVPNPCRFTKDTYALLLCHELGHANGWPGDHRGGHFVPKAVMDGLPRYGPRR